MQKRESVQCYVDMAERIGNIWFGTVLSGTFGFERN